MTLSIIYSVVSMHTKEFDNFVGKKNVVSKKL